MLPVEYWSRLLSAPEKNYYTGEKKCLAVVWSILTLRPQLYGDNFTLRTNHPGLKWILDLPDSSRRLARWHLRLAAYDYEVKYRKRPKHEAVHGESRLQKSEEE